MSLPLTWSRICPSISPFEAAGLSGFTWWEIVDVLKKFFKTFLRCFEDVCRYDVHIFKVQLFGVVKFVV